MRASIQQWRRVACFVSAVVACLVLAGCPGDSPPSEPAQVPPLTLSGTVSIDGTPAAQTLVVIKGKSGHVRETSTDDKGHYVMPVAELMPPYFVEAAGSHSVVMAAGIADVTPLTELAFTDIVRQDTHLYFVNLDMTLSDTGEFGDASSDTSRITASSIAAGEADALKFLKSIYAVTPVTGTGDLFHSGFSATANDPMAKTLQAYTTAVADTGIQYSILQQIKLCEDSDVTITQGTDAIEFCQLSAKVNASTTDATVSVYEFFTQSHDHIVLSARNTAVLSVGFTPREGTAFSCSGTTCGGIVLGAAGSDGNRTLAFNQATLKSDGGASAILQGHLIAGTTFPRLTCTGEQVYFRQGGDYTGGDCIANPYAQLAFGRSIHTFPSATGQASVEVRLDGSVVASVLHYGYDENGALVAKFKCRSTQCANVTVSAADAEGTRTITLQGTLLQAVNADGTLSTTDSELINAALTLAVPEAPPVITCNAGDPGFTVTVTGQPALQLCVPDPASRYATLNDDGSINYVFTNYNTLTVVALDRAVISAALDSFSCSTAPCAGITVSAVNSTTDKRTVRLNNAPLPEIETGGLIGDRTAVITGNAATPTTACILTGACP